MKSILSFALILLGAQILNLSVGDNAQAQSNPNREWVWTADCRPEPAHPQLSLVVIKTNLADALSKRMPARGLAFLTGQSWMKYAMIIDQQDNIFRVFNGRGTLLTVDMLQQPAEKDGRRVYEAVGGELLPGLKLKCEFAI